MCLSHAAHSIVLYDNWQPRTPDGKRRCVGSETPSKVSESCDSEITLTFGYDPAAARRLFPHLFAAD